MAELLNTTGLYQDIVGSINIWWVSRPYNLGGFGSIPLLAKSYIIAQQHLPFITMCQVIRNLVILFVFLLKITLSIFLVFSQYMYVFLFDRWHRITRILSQVDTRGPRGGAQATQWEFRTRGAPPTPSPTLLRPPAGRGGPTRGSPANRGKAQQETAPAGVRLHPAEAAQGEDGQQYAYSGNITF